MLLIVAGGDGRVKEKGTALLQTSPQVGSVLQACTVREFIPTVADAKSIFRLPSGWAATETGTQAGPVSL